MDPIDKLLHPWMAICLEEDPVKKKDLDMDMIKRIKKLPADYRGRDYWHGGLVAPLLLEIVTYLKDKYPN